jgi:hypothetical protein
MKTSLTFFTQATGWYQPLPDMDSPQTLVLVFGNYKFKTLTQPFLDLRETYPQSIIAGCSGHGAIFAEKLMSNALVVCVVRFEHTQLRFAIQELENSQNSLQAAEQLAEALIAPGLQGVFILTDGIHTNGSELVKGLNRRFGQDIAVAGGLAADELAFQDSWVLQEGMPVSKRICGIGFYGQKIHFISHAKDGWKPFGPERLITKAEHNVLYELDGQPALELYKQYLGDKAKDLPAAGLHFPLSITSPYNTTHMVRTILGIDEQQQSMSFAGDIPSGFKAQLIYGSFDNLVEGAEEVALQLTRTIKQMPEQVLALAVSCAARRLVMQEDTEMELEATLENLPKGTTQAGFYAFGELCPKLEEGICGLHNQTMTLTVIYEGS